MQHEELEAFLDLMSPALSVDRYGKILGAFETFYSWFEPVMDQVLSPRLSALLDWPSRHKLTNLHSDLDALGLELSGPRTAALDSSSMPSLADDAAVLGALYVVEGATLGGQFIAPHVRELGIGDDCTSFFTSYRDQTGVRWKVFRSAANEELSTPESLDIAVATAGRTFGALHQLCAKELSR